MVNDSFANWFNDFDFSILVWKSSASTILQHKVGPTNMKFC